MSTNLFIIAIALVAFGLSMWWVVTQVGSMSHYEATKLSDELARSLGFHESDFSAYYMELANGQYTHALVMHHGNSWSARYRATCRGLTFREHIIAQDCFSAEQATKELWLDLAVREWTPVVHLNRAPVSLK